LRLHRRDIWRGRGSHEQAAEDSRFRDLLDTLSQIVGHGDKA
jgi:hypothetical protein